MPTVKAHYDGKKLVLDEPVDLPKDEPLLIHIEHAKPPKPNKKRKKKQSLFKWLAENSVDSKKLPADLAHQHDHYLYGTPKKPTG